VARDKSVRLSEDEHRMVKLVQGKLKRIGLDEANGRLPKGTKLESFTQGEIIEAGAKCFRYLLEAKR